MKISDGTSTEDMQPNTPLLVVARGVCSFVLVCPSVPFLLAPHSIGINWDVALTWVAEQSLGMSKPPRLHALQVRLSPAIVERLAAVASALPGGSKSGCAAAAIEAGLVELEHRFLGARS